MFQTLDRNSKILLIFLKGKLPYILKKCIFMFIKCLIVTKAKRKIVKILTLHNRLETITLIGIGGRCPGVIGPGN